MHRKPLETARAKLNRAKHHLKQLQTDMQPAGVNEAYGIEVINYTDINQIVVRAKLPRPLLVKLAVMAGEVIHQARSALEHAVWELVPSPVPNRTGFPIFFKESDYKGRGHPMIEGINDKAKTFIDGLQPLGPNYASDSLYILNEAWKWDKHRLLNVCGFFPYGCTIYYRFPNHFENQTFVFPTDAEDGAELFRAAHPGPEVEVHVTMAYGGFVFRDGPASVASDYFPDASLPNEFVLDILRDWVQLVEGIIDILAETI